MLAMLLSTKDVQHCQLQRQLSETTRSIKVRVDGPLLKPNKHEIVRTLYSWLSQLLCLAMHRIVKPNHTSYHVCVVEFETAMHH